MIQFYDEEGMISPIDDGILDKEYAGLKFDTAISAFSDFLFNALIEKHKAKRVGAIRGGIDRPIYMIEQGGKHIAVYQSSIGASAAAMAMEEMRPIGIKNFVVFGICGALTHVPQRTFIVPDKAYRDEGTSYHYLPPAEFITVKNSAEVDKIVSKHAGTLIGGTWSTDGFYRETREAADKMRALDCVAVDMECSALQAVCDYRGTEFYTFFITADSLADENWEPNYILDQKVTPIDVTAINAAVELAFSLCKEQ